MKNADKIVNGTSYIRRAGFLMPIFSLPSPYGIGDFGKGAYDFVRFLEKTGHKLWEVLPHGPTGFCNSPYKSVSAFAGNPYYISPELLCADKLLTTTELVQFNFGKTTDNIDYAVLFAQRFKMLRLAFHRWQQNGGEKTPAYINFKKEQKFWLKDYCLYMSCKEKFNFQPWHTWPEDIRNRSQEGLKKYTKLCTPDIIFWSFVQHMYFKQWQNLKNFAHLHKVEIIGDIPFYMEYDSVDVWSRRTLFQINPQTQEIELYAGVPADAFANHSRNWGMPCYNWETAEKTKFSWHLQRFSHNACMYDIIRIDHALGYIRYYGINNQTEQWCDGPDAITDKLVSRITKLAHQHKVEIIAEDLGSVPERAYRLFTKYSWYSTRVLQFGFSNKYGTQTIHLPFYYPHKSLACTGTHDNPTLKNYLESIDKANLPYIMHYINTPSADLSKIHKRLIEELYKSAAELVVIPLPDILELGTEGRICFGCDYTKSWRWKLTSLKNISPQKQKWLRRMAFAYARLPFSTEEGKNYGWIWK